MSGAKQQYKGWVGDIGIAKDTTLISVQGSNPICNSVETLTTSSVVVRGDVDPAVVSAPDTGLHEGGEETSSACSRLRGEQSPLVASGGISIPVGTSLSAEPKMSCLRTRCSTCIREWNTIQKQWDEELAM